MRVVAGGIECRAVGAMADRECRSWRGLGAATMSRPSVRLDLEGRTRSIPVSDRHGREMVRLEADEVKAPTVVGARQRIEKADACLAAGKRE